MSTITVQKRDPAAKAKQLRRAGIVPCVIFGAELPESLSVQLGQNEARQLRRTKQDGSKVNVLLEGKTYPTLVRELEYSGASGQVVHISFQVLQAGKKYNSVADIVLLNRDKVAGVLEQMRMRIPHAAEPQNLLDTVAVDLEQVPVGTTLTVGDIPELCSGRIELQVDPKEIVLRISDKKRADARPEGQTAAENLPS